ncbi:tetratricopeptide repeat protein [Marinoscillum sp.]|uniref:ATP-binding protein n=1 Tax=Marinoscillum sp. TaxID=2024838 RepID=UPI003BA9C798
MKFLQILTLTLTVIASQQAFAQDLVYSDSLKTALTQLPKDQQIDLLWTLAREYAASDSLKAIEIFQQLEQSLADPKKVDAMKLGIEANLMEAANQLEAAKKAYSNAYDALLATNQTQKAAQISNDLAALYGRQSQFDSLKLSAERACDLFVTLGDTLGMVPAYSNVGRAYQLMGQFDSALVTFFKAIELMEAYEPSPLLSKIHLRHQGNVYNNIGITYMEQEDLESAKKFYDKAVKKKKALGDLKEVGNMMLNIGGIKFQEGDPIAARGYLDSAAFYYEKTRHSLGLLLCCTNSAAVSNMVGEFAKGIEYAKDGAHIAKELDDQTNVALNYIHLGTAYWRLGNKRLSNAYLDSSAMISRAIDSKRVMSEVQNLKYEFALEDKDFEKALTYRNEYFATKDSMYQVQKSREISELETQYKTSEKEQEIALLEKENELNEATIQRNTFLLVGLIILLVLLIVIFYFIRYRTRQQHQAVLQEQKIRMREHQMQAVIDSQERERKRFATDLHDGMGQLISALQLNIQSMNEVNGDHDKRDQLYGNSTTLLHDIHSEIRNIAFNLMPQTLMKAGLVDALEELIHRINKTEKIKVNLSVYDLDERLPEVVEVSLYRIIQEFLSNIMKYSKAENVYLGITNHEDELVLTIEDDGLGYDLEKFKVSEGNGWRNINSRINLIKGELDIDTSEGQKGSSVVINIDAKDIERLRSVEVASN